MEILATIPVHNHPWIYNLTFATATIIFIIGIVIGLFMSIEYHSWGALL